MLIQRKLPADKTYTRTHSDDHAMTNFITRITDPAQTQPDLLVDELHDRISAGGMNREDTGRLVKDLLQILTETSDDALSESICNLLATIYYQGIAQESIAVACMAIVDRLKTGSLIHVLDILEAEDVIGSQDLLARFAASSDPVVRERAQEILSK